MRIFRFPALVLALYVALKSGCKNTSTYEIQNIRYDDIYLTLGDRIIVGSTIVDYDFSGRYIIGIRIPVRFLTCKYSHKAAGEFISSEIRFNTNVEYFIVDTETDKVSVFSDTNEFRKAMDESAIIASSLDYTKAEDAREKYESVRAGDTDTALECSDYPISTREYQKSSY